MRQPAQAAFLQTLSCARLLCALARHPSGWRPAYVLTVLGVAEPNAVAYMCRSGKIAAPSCVPGKVNVEGGWRIGRGGEVGMKRCLCAMSSLVCEAGALCVMWLSARCGSLGRWMWSLPKDAFGICLRLVALLLAWAGFRMFRKRAAEERLTDGLANEFEQEAALQGKLPHSILHAVVSCVLAVSYSEASTRAPTLTRGHSRRHRAPYQRPPLPSRSAGLAPCHASPSHAAGCVCAVPFGPQWDTAVW